MMTRQDLNTILYEYYINNFSPILKHYEHTTYWQVFRKRTMDSNLIIPNMYMFFQVNMHALTIRELIVSSSTRSIGCSSAPLEDTYIKSLVEHLRATIK